MELDKLITHRRKAHLMRLWEISYFVANLMATQVTGITPEKLMQPFLPKKTRTEKESEREQFFKDFYNQRKEAER